VGELWAAVRDVAAAQLAELDRLAGAYLGDRSTLQTITRGELAARLRRRDVLLIDVRPAAEYHSGHITGARSLPPHKVATELAGLGGDRDIVAYCRGAYCVYDDEAVRELTARGYRAARLEDGFPEWAAAGLPVERAG